MDTWKGNVWLALELFRELSTSIRLAVVIVTDAALITDHKTHYRQLLDCSYLLK